MDVLAEHRLLASYPTGESVPVYLHITRPVNRPKGGWACQVAGEGLRSWNGPTQIYGSGSLQALVRSLRFLHEVLSGEVRQGAIFRQDSTGRRTIDLDELFGAHSIT